MLRAFPHRCQYIGRERNRFAMERPGPYCYVIRASNFSHWVWTCPCTCLPLHSHIHHWIISRFYTRFYMSEQAPTFLYRIFDSPILQLVQTCKKLQHYISFRDRLTSLMLEKNYYSYVL